MAKASLTVAIVPARGGSKGVPRKNLRPVAGRPLIHHTIEAALRASSVDRVVVSTEDPEIARTSIGCGAEVIDRPRALASDASPTIDTVLHAIDALSAGGACPSIVVLLQPTSPLREPEDIDRGVAMYRKGGCGSVVSVTSTGHPPYWALRIQRGFLSPAFDPRYLRSRRQDLPETYIPNGAIYISSPRAIRRNGGFLGPRARPLLMPPERSVDVDTELDLALVEVLMSRREGGRP